MKSFPLSRALLIGGLAGALTLIYCATYMVLRCDGTLTRYYSTGDGQQILGSREYRHSEAVLLGFSDPIAAKAFADRNARFLGSMEVLFAPLRFLEARLHRNPDLSPAR